ncbi:NAD(P)/FAD-dependent oxidoreductase [Streptomyces gobiensis]|uniref:NAD(P)/FAD-dependent oxidoreductase n=1 Tax=Streptomyces gobiensis TaxID=2875706 RepID=UPI001E560049|nr:FAD-dependent oxidoreductase [Streptomyces gobiensis]UGY91119.1 FAD-binding oxidoreductase [Streptomyces gobiensis]
MAERTTADVVIVGNGVLGLSIAFETAVRSPGLRIAVIGPTARPGSATVAAGAMLNCFAEVTRFTGAHPASRAKFELARDALDAWPQWLDRLVESTGSPAPLDAWTPGTLLLLGAQATPGTVQNFEAVRAATEAHGEPHEEVDIQDIEGLDALPPEHPVRALCLEREGAVDARAVLAALEAAAGRQGVVEIPGEVTGLVTVGERATGVRLSTGETVTSDTVVLAAGSPTQRLIEELPVGMVQPMLHGTGFAVETRRHRGPGFGHVVRTPTRSGGCGLHLVPLGGGTEYIGATNIALFDPPDGPRVGIAQSLLRFAMEQFDRRIGFSSVRRWHYGNRPITLDTFPLIGRSPMPGLLFATGTYRDGFHSSPVIARYLAGLIVESAAEQGPCAMFTPGRAPLETMTTETATELYATETADTSIEFGLRLPYFLGTEALTSMRRRQAQESFDRLGRSIALRPEILSAVYEADDSRVKQLAAYLHAAPTPSPS